MRTCCFSASLLLSLLPPLCQSSQPYGGKKSTSGPPLVCFICLGTSQSSAFCISALCVPSRNSGVICINASAPPCFNAGGWSQPWLSSRQATSLCLNGRPLHCTRWDLHYSPAFSWLMRPGLSGSSKTALASNAMMVLMCVRTHRHEHEPQNAQV